ncbi:MAG: GNAT family N-acetyltransferase [Betaproteobacteria bacterium]|nr:GNAT family N-acetyltransferase [Betaproteobacteria bacterium]
MKPHYLSPFFSPQSIAVVGAGNHTDSLGGQVLSHLLTSGYRGRLYPVHLSESRVQGLQAYASLAQLPELPDLVMLATPAPTTPDLVEQCGRLGLRAVVVLSAGFSETGEAGQALETRLLEQARQHRVRLLGPNCIGVMRPAIGLTSPFVKAGSLALVSQSTALTSGVLDWASGNEIGFSTVVSIGNSADIDFPEVVDFLVSDLQTQSILLFIENIRHPRSFMSALREAARVKPVIVLKADRWGQVSDQSEADGSHHTMAEIHQADAIFDAALRRAGVVRVHSMTQLFSAARACSVRYRKSGPHLAIVSNGDGPGALAADRALDHHVPLARLSQQSFDRLGTLLPPGQRRGNPLNLGNNAPASLYRDTGRILLDDPQVDGLLVMLCPQARSEPVETARQVIELARSSSKPVLASWIGDRNVLQGRALFSAAQVPNFRTPESAVDAFHYVVLYNRNQQMLFQTPPPSAAEVPPQLAPVKEMLRQARDTAGVLGDLDAERLLSAFHVPFRSGLPPPLFPGRAQGPYALRLGLVRDRMLGPALYLGPSGLASELPHALTYALPPLNPFLAHELIERSTMAPLLAAHGKPPVVDADALSSLLLRVSEMACELPEVDRIDLEVWFSPQEPALVSQARIQLSELPLPKSRYGHMAVHPYPAELVKTIALNDGTPVTLRPIRPEDAEMEQTFVKSLSEDTRYYRFMDALRELPRAMLVRFTQLDYSREMAIIAVVEEAGREIQIGVARYSTNPDGESCEFALVISDAWQGHGLGRDLMQYLMQIAATNGLKSMEGEVLAGNTAMLHLMSSLGFATTTSPDDPGIRIVSRSLETAAA